MADSPTSQTAADIMQKHIITVGPKDSLQEVLQLITENHVTGLPVLDSKSRCVGVISMADILNYEQENAEASAEANADVAKFFDPEKQRWESMRLSSFAVEQFGDVPVGELMTRELVSVGPETSVREVAQTMVERDVHRIVVLDDRQYLLGIISAFDFVRLAAF